MTYILKSRAKHGVATLRFPTIWSFISVYRQRKTLEHLDDAALEDIGVTSKEAKLEAKRAWWDIAANSRH